MPIARGRIRTGSSDLIATCSTRRRRIFGSGGDFCGLSSNLNFGRPVFSITYDPDTINGWGKRSYDWNFGVQVQQELLPRVSVNVGYFRRIFGNFFVTDNLATSAADYNTFSITAPADPRLPGGGGYTVVGIWWT